MPIHLETLALKLDDNSLGGPAGPFGGHATLVGGLISYWKLKDTADSHGSNTLTNNNGVTFVAGKIGDAANFVAASSQFLHVASNASLQTGDIAFTFSGWFKATSGAGTHCILAKDPAATANEYQLYVDNSDTRLNFAVNDGATKTVSVTGLSTSAWHFFVAWHDPVANKIFLQVDNGSVAETATGTLAVANSGAFGIGALAVPDFSLNDYEGPIDEIGFWKRLLTAQERTDLYNSGAGLTY